MQRHRKIALSLNQNRVGVKCLLGETALGEEPLYLFFLKYILLFFKACDIKMYLHVAGVYRGEALWLAHI